MAVVEHTERPDAIIKMLTHAHTHTQTHTHTPHSKCQASRACSHQIKEMPLQTLSCGNVYQNGTKIKYVLTFHRNETRKRELQ